MTLHSAGNASQDTIRGPHNLTLAGEDARNGSDLRTAADANLLLFVAGRGDLYDTGGIYRRDEESSGCKGADSACVWTDFFFRGRIGDTVIGWETSVSSVKVGMGMNSVLGFFPDTEAADLVQLTKACLKRSGEDIEELLRQSGGLGVVNGRTVKVAERRLTVPVS